MLEEVSNDASTEVKEAPTPENSALVEVTEVPELGVKVYKFGEYLYLYKGKILLPLKGEQGFRITEDSITLSWG